MIPETPKIAFAYCRVSSPKQVREGHGLQSQQVICEEFAKLKGLDVVASFHDDVTGGEKNRRAMNDMIASLRAYRKRGIKVAVIIDAPDRFARDVRGHWDCATSCARQAAI